MEYYLHTHVPMVDEASGKALKGIAVDQGICGREPDSSPDYAAIGHMYFDSVDAYRNAFGPHAVEPSKAGPLMRSVNGCIGHFSASDQSNPSVLFQ